MLSYSASSLAGVFYSNFRDVWFSLEYTVSKGLVWCLKYCAQGIILGFTLATLASVPWVVLLGWWKYEQDRI